MAILWRFLDLFISAVVHVITAAPFLCYLLIGAFLAALLFNILHEVMG